MKRDYVDSKSFMVSILSLSLLTVMAGAAVAPALGVIKEYFYDCNPLFVQMIVSIPAVFIVITNCFFARLCRAFGSKSLVMAGLLLYTAGGCLAGVFNNIFLVLAARALVGIGVGIIMPLSTGLLSYYGKPEQQSRLMGYSSAMNQMGGVIATLLSGILASISWRASFLVYLLGLISIVLCLIFLPNEKINSEKQKKSSEKIGGTIKNYYSYILAMFLLMSAFFIYPTNFAILVEADGIIPFKYVAVIMAMMDLVAFCGGLLFVFMQKVFRNKTKYIAPILFFLGYALLTVGGVAGTLIGSVFIGFANGLGIPLIISSASIKSGKSAVTTIMPLLSASLYLAQFLCPILVSAVTAVVGSQIPHLAYWIAVVLSIFLFICSIFIPKADN